VCERVSVVYVQQHGKQPYEYERSAELLRSTQNLLNGIAYFSIEVNHDIAPLYELKDAHSSLLDVKG
ncbi:MAG: hypothetical protein K2M51_05445, partial [Helicobacter sp.]|nr:hypothetical protein [Helicobacter sp.]